MGDRGNVLGHYCSLTCVTKDYLTSRRQLTINRVSEVTAGVQNLADFYTRVLETLKENIYDIPFCLLYSVDAERQQEDYENHIPMVDKTDFSFAKLEGQVGVQLNECGHPVALLLQDDAFKRTFQVACRKGEILTSKVGPGLTDTLLQDLNERGYGDLPDSIVFCPITPMTQKTTAALLLLGLNTRRPLDDDYQSFIRSLSRAVSSSLASVMLLNMASRRTLQAAQGEQIAKSMLEVAPV